jgi:hypothetical protein
MRGTPSGGDAERAPAKTGSQPGDKYDGRSNPKAGSTTTPVNTRDGSARIIRWNKTA